MTTLSFSELEEKHKTGLKTLKELFIEWSDDDLLSLLEDYDGDIQLIASRITEGYVKPFSKVPVHTKPQSSTAQKGRYAKNTNTYKKEYKDRRKDYRNDQKYKKSYQGKDSSRHYNKKRDEEKKENDVETSEKKEEVKPSSPVLEAHPPMNDDTKVENDEPVVEPNVFPTQETEENQAPVSLKFGSLGLEDEPIGKSSQEQPQPHQYPGMMSFPQNMSFPEYSNPGFYGHQESHFPQMGFYPPSNVPREGSADAPNQQMPMNQFPFQYYYPYYMPGPNQYAPYGQNMYSKVMYYNSGYFPQQPNQAAQNNKVDEKQPANTPFNPMSDRLYAPQQFPFYPMSSFLPH
ncbi:hypothetical protein ROZALSC1DRAFT_29846, partial [Rozella allomycis CSF55]